MGMKTTVVEIARDGTLKLPPDLRHDLGDPRQLSVIRVGSSFVLAPIPEKWTKIRGRIICYQGGLIARDPRVMFGAPVIAGTRIPVRTIVGYIESGLTPTQIREEFPHLTNKQIDAAMLFYQRRSTRRTRKRSHSPR